MNDVMKFGLSKSQKRVLLAIEKYKAEHGVDMSPTIRELQSLTGYASTSSVWCILRMLRLKKWIWFLDGVSRSIMISRGEQ